jgi:hypothetical protein
VYCLHRLLGVTGPLGSARRERRIEPGDLLRGQLHLQCTDVFLYGRFRIDPVLVIQIDSASSPGP